MEKFNQTNDIFKKLAEESSNDLSRKEKTWEKIEQRLDEKKSSKRILFAQYSGIAASVILLCSVLYFLMQREETIQPSTEIVIKKDKSESKNLITKENIQPDNEVEIAQHQEQKKLSQISNHQNKIGSISNSSNESSKVISNDFELINNDLASNKSNIEVENVSLKTVSVKNLDLIKGKLIDLNGFAIEDAEITLRGNNQTVYSDDEGLFEITASIGDSLMIDDGFGNQKLIAINHQNLKTIEIGKQNVELQSVAIIGGVKLNEPQLGYSMPLTKSKIKNSTASYGVQTEKNLDKALGGRVASVTISQNNGIPGSATNVTIRGVSSLNQNNNPLYVVDGVVMQTNVIQSINPNDIKEINVLKENSATALYGSRGVNGVIIIQTKKGLTKKELRKLNRKAKKESIVSAFSQEIIKPKLVEVSKEEYSSFIENQFENPLKSPLSTFSIDVDKASYSNIRRFLNYGQTVPKDAVRVEEMINYFQYNYPQPKNDLPIALQTEYSDSPWNKENRLLKIGLQAKDLPVNDLPNSNLVFLIDVSGSMSDENKLPLLKKSLNLLVDKLRSDDKVSIVTYAGSASVVLKSTSGKDKNAIKNAIENLSASGSTAGADGIILAYDLAQKNFIKNGNNRVVLATDGDFNVGLSSGKELEDLIEQKRKSGVFLTCLGYGMGNYKDNRMAVLSKKGNGNYAYIDNLQEANKFLIREFSGTIYTLAKDVKIQVEFNPNLVKSYRLIGYETRLLNDEDFVNDSIDAGEIGAGHQVTALYEIVERNQTDRDSIEQTLKYSQVQMKDNFQNELATIKFRYKKPDENSSKEITQIVQNQYKKLSQSSEDFKFAASVAWFGLKLRDSDLIQNKETSAIKDLVKQAMKTDVDGYKAELLRLVELVK